MKVLVTPKAEKELKSLPTQMARQILQEFLSFSRDPNWWQSSKVKKLVDSPFYRYKTGDYRIIFDQNGNLLQILHVKKRSEKTYKGL